MFENRRRGRQARNFGKNVPKILDLKSSSEQIFSENCRWVPLYSVCYIHVVDITDRSYYEFSCKMRKRYLVYTREINVFKNLEMALPRPSLAIHCRGRQLADTVVLECINCTDPSRFNRFYRSPMRLEFHKI